MADRGTYEVIILRLRSSNLTDFAFFIFFNTLALWTGWVLIFKETKYILSEAKDCCRELNFRTSEGLRKRGREFNLSGGCRMSHPEMEEVIFRFGSEG